VSSLPASFGPAAPLAVGPQSPSVQEQKLRRAAGEFESILLSSFWKSMKESFASSEDDSSDPAHETLEDWGIQAMSDAVGKAGGLGIGKLIIKHLEPQLAANLQAEEAKFH
jgi:Rod binding domain-containing protein